MILNISNLSKSYVGQSVLKEVSFHLEEKEKAAHVHIVETVEKRITVGQTDIGKELQVRIDDLKELADAYQKGHLKERIQ